MASEGIFPPFPEFLRVYNSQNLSQRLVIPRGNRQYYPRPLPRTAVLRKPEGHFWNVKWKVSQDETVSFEVGWAKFVKDNELMEGDFLIFTYEPPRDFWVRIFRNGFIVMAKGPINIHEISDDEEETNGNDDHHMEEEEEKEENRHENMIISLSLGTSDEVGAGADDDDDSYAICEVNQASGSSKKRGWAAKRDLVASVKDPEKYLDNPRNPFFISTSSCSRRVLVIAMQAIKDYVLNFDRTINIIDELGEVKKKIGKWSDRIVVYKWDEIYERNKAKPGDVIICEILREDDIVRALKIHIIKK